MSKKKPEVSETFWRQAVLWGIVVALIIGALGSLAGSIDGRRGAILFGLLGLGIGFGLGFLLKAIGKLPPRKGAQLSRGNYIGGNRMPDIEDASEFPKKK